MYGADLAVLVVPFLDGSSNRIEASTDLEEVGMVSAAESDEVCSVSFFGGGPLLLLGVGSCIKQSSEDG